jgi:hypothetical protein
LVDRWRTISSATGPRVVAPSVGTDMRLISLAGAGQEVAKSCLTNLGLQVV